MPRSVLLLLVLSLAALSAQQFISPIRQQEVLTISQHTLQHKLKAALIFIDSDSVFTTSGTLQRGRDYHIDYTAGYISFFQPAGTVRLVYQYYPTQLAVSARQFTPFNLSDSTSAPRIKPKKSLFYNDTNLTIAGSKTIAISVSNNDDFSLDQSLYLRLSGEMSPNMKIEAQLTDSQTPITPEGDSREISNLDKIFIRLYGKQYEVAFGDLEMQFSGTRFLNYTPKFEGLKAGWWKNHRIQGAVAVAKGKKTTSTFSGVEAKQGPYYMSQAQSSGIQVVAGTEEVYLDGVRLQRGDDYSIDYAEGSITFRPQHFISSSSFIMVEYQYTDEEYRQSMYLASGALQLTPNLTLSAGLISQVDDKDNPLLEEFTPEDLTALQNAGDQQAWGNGITPVADGQGAYNKVISGDEEYYEYAGPDGEGDYNIVFSFVGWGQGTYQQSADGLFYEYVGYSGSTALGAWMPVKKLPSPQSRQNYDVRTQYKTDWLSLIGETMLSSWDANTFSSLDDEDNTGMAAYGAIKAHPQWERIAPSLSLEYQHKDRQLSPFAQLTNPLELYEFTPLPDSVDQTTYAANASAVIAKRITPAVSYQYAVGEDFATQTKLSSSITSQQQGWLPSGRLNLTSYQQQSESIFAEESEVLAHTTDLSWKYKAWQLSGTTYYRRAEESISLLTTGQKTRRQSIKLGTQGRTTLNASAEYKQERIDSLAASWYKATTSYTTTGQIKLTAQQHQADLLYSHRAVTTDSTRSFNIASLTMRNSWAKKAIQLRSQYNLKNVEFYPKVRQLQFVGEELGLYDSLGVLSDDGEYDWIITAIDYDNPQMSVEINANATLNLVPKNITQSFWSRIQWESYLLRNENTAEEKSWKLYLLHPDATMQNSSIYSSRTFRNTLWIDLIRRSLSGKVRHQSDKTLDNRYNATTETIEKEQWQASLQYRMPERSSLELTTTWAEEQDSRLQQSIENSEVELDYRRSITQQLSSSTASAFTREEGIITSSNATYTMDSYTLRQQLTWLWATKYRAFGQMELRYNQREGIQATSFFDKNDGLVTKWHLTIDYRMNSVTTAVLSYAGKNNPADPAEHELRMEIKAEF